MRGCDPGSFFELGKRLIAVKLSKDCSTPVPLPGTGATWALSFNYEAIKKAIDTAYER